MALSKLGEGTEDAMQLLAGFGSELDDGGAGGAGGSGSLLNLAVERFARIASSIIASGSVKGIDFTPGPEREEN